MACMVAAAASCGAMAQTLTIGTIQGSGAASPYAGSTVTVSGIVTAIGPAGFFIQSPPGGDDGDPETSEGLYVYTATPPTVTVGDGVEVVGTVKEFHALTEISQPTRVDVVSSGSALPATVSFDATLPSHHAPQPADALERFEGMRVEVAAGTVTGPSRDDGSFFIVAGGDRAFREPGIRFPGLPGLPVWDGNPEVLLVYPAAFGPGIRAVAGASVTMTGVLAQYETTYELWPVTVAAGSIPLPRPVAAGAPGSLRIATQNLYRLVDAVDDPLTDDPVPSPVEAEARLAKAALWVKEALGSPEILAVQEVENSVLLAGLGSRAADPGWGAPYRAYLEEGSDPSGIDVGFLVAPAVEVESVGQIGASAAFSLDGRSYATFDRPPLELRVRVPSRRSPRTLALVNVHLRSLNGIEGEGADFVRAKRKAGAEWLAAWVQAVQEDEPNLGLAVVGDFNAYEFSDGYVDVIGEISGQPDPRGALLPAAELVSPGLTDAIMLLPAAERYSYVEEGNAAALDHALLSKTLLPWVREVAFARGNADAPATRASDATACRASDHDGLVVVLAPNAPRPPRVRLTGR
jgi:predicted extracellular nuclease